MNTWEHGLPQNRPRLYIAAIRAGCVDVNRRFTWPKRIVKCHMLKDMLCRKQKGDNVTIVEMTKTMRSNHDFAKVEAKKKGFDFKSKNKVCEICFGVCVLQYVFFVFLQEQEQGVRLGCGRRQEFSPIGCRSFAMRHLRTRSVRRLHVAE